MSAGDAERALALRQLARAYRVARRAGRKAWSTAYELLPPTRTGVRIRARQYPPPPSAFAAFGDGSWIVPPARVIGAGRMVIGSGVIVMDHAALVVGPEGNLVVGDGVRLTRFNTITCAIGVEIGDNVASSDSATIIDTWVSPLAGWSGLEPPSPPAPVVIEDGAYLGMNSIVGPGVRVGTGAFVGEGAVVTDDVPPFTVVYGNPARVTRRLDPATREWEGPLLPTAADMRR